MVAAHKMDRATSRKRDGAGVGLRMVLTAIIITSTPALVHSIDCTVTNPVAGRIQYPGGRQSVAHPTTRGTLDYCIRMASTNTDVRVLFNIRLSDPNALFAVITLTTFVDFTFNDMFPPRAADFGRLELVGDSQPLSASALRARPADMPRVYFVPDPTRFATAWQATSAYGTVWPYGFVMSGAPLGSLSSAGTGRPAPTADVRLLGLGFHGFGPQSVAEYLARPSGWRAPAAIYLYGASGLIISRCHFNASFHGVEASYNPTIKRMTYNVTIESSRFTDTFLGIRVHSMWGSVRVANSEFGIGFGGAPSTGGTAIQAVANTRSYPASLEGSTDVGSNQPPSWPISPNQFYRVDQIIVENCTVRDHTSHLLTSEFVGEQIEESAAIILQADNATVIGGTVGPTRSLGITNKANSGSTARNLRVQGTVVTNASIGIYPIGSGTAVVDVTVRHCLTGLLLTTEAIAPQVQGGVFEYNGNPDGFGGYGIFVGASRATVSNVTVRYNHQRPLFIEEMAENVTLSFPRVYDNNPDIPNSIFVEGAGARIINPYVGVGPDGNAPPNWWVNGSGFVPRNPRVGILVGSDATHVVITGDPTSPSTACVVGGHSVFGIALQGDHAIVSGCIVGLNSNGTLLASNGIGLVVQANDVTIGSTDRQIRTVVSGNTGDGIRVNANSERTVIINSHVGTDLSGMTAMEPTGTNGIGNGDLGINIDSSTIDTMIGGSDPTLRVVVSGNGFIGGLPGMLLDGRRVVVSNAIVGPNRAGLDRCRASNGRPTFNQVEANAFGNRAGGIKVRFSGPVSILGDFDGGMPTVVGGNGFGEPSDGGARLSDGQGIVIERSATVLLHGLYVGVGADGATPLGNRHDGVYGFINRAASDNLTITSCVLASGADPRYGVPADGVNGGYALRIQGYSATIANCKVGVDSAERSVIGTTKGVFLDQFSDNTTMAGCTVGGVSDGAAILVEQSTGVVVQNCFVGLPSTGRPSAGFANHGPGIRINLNSPSAVVDNNHVGNNRGTGIDVRSQWAVVRGNRVGFDLRQIATNNSNIGNGIHIGRHVPCALHGNVVKYSALEAILDDSRQPWEAAAGNDIDNTGGTNGWANTFCDRCVCSPRLSPTIVDCRNPSAPFGNSFPTALPPTTEVLLLGGDNVGLLYLPWESLGPAMNSLERLDAHGNPGLRALPARCTFEQPTQRPPGCTVAAGPSATTPPVSTSAACSFASYTALKELTMDETDISALRPQSFQFQSLRDNLDTLSIVSDSRTVPGLDIDLSGFHQLGAVAWFNASRCPRGFYSTKTTPDTHRLCYRCPRQTFSNTSFATDSSVCERCETGKFDFDFDPTTPCTEGNFTTSSLWDPANFTIDIRGNYTLGTTYNIESPLAAMQRTINVDVTLAELFDGIADDPTNDEDGVAAIEFGVQLFSRTVSGSRAFLNHTESGSTLLVNPKTGQAIMNFTHRTEGVEAVLQAYDASRASTVMKTWTFDMLPADTLDPANGPNGQDCLDSNQRVDTIELDLHYVCDCTNFAAMGDNCEIPVLAQAATQTDEKTTTALYSALAALAFVALIVILYLRHRIYVWKMRVEDMKDIQASMLEKLGLAGIDLKDGEVAIVIQFTDLDIDPDSQSALSFCSNLRTHLTTRFAEDQFGDDIMSIDMTSPNACSVKFNAGITEGEGAEDALAEISTDIEDFPIELFHDGGAAVSSRCFVAIQSRPPREIEKKNVMRLEMIGKGAFGEVYRGLLQESQRGVPSCLVAMKMMLTAAQDSRDDLLNEAALMGAFSHFNIINIIGVVTIPKDLPAILLMEYCEHGSLLSYLIESDAAAEATIVDLMTFCSDVAAGLTYLHRMRFVHRDIAARNVLVNSAVHCKIADFGMSMVVDEDSLADYVEVKANAAARWCSPEALLESRFSPASDTWAFGVLVHEIFTYGGAPFEDIATAHEVKAYVKGGGLIERDDLVPESIYNNVMLPCFERDVSKRAKMSEILRRLAKMGGHDSHVSVQVSSRRSKATSANSGASAATNSGTASGASHANDSDLNMDGVSVHHLVKVLRGAASKGLDQKMSEEKKAGRPFLEKKEDASIWHMVQAYVMPATKTKKCAYVEWLPQFGPDHVGPANALLSYCWGYKYTDVVSALESWCTAEKRNPKRTYVWICSLCVNQHDASAEVKTADFFKREFGERVKAIGTILPLMLPWDEPLYLTRAWCLFELYTAISFEGACTITAIFTPEQEALFREALTSGGYSKVDDTLEKIRSQNATATMKADEDAIKQTIKETLLGGYQGLDNLVRSHLQEFFHKSGAIRSAGRVKRLGASAKTSSMSASFSTSREISYNVENTRADVREKRKASGFRTSFTSSERIVEPTSVPGFSPSMIGSRARLQSGLTGIIRFVGRDISSRVPTAAIGIELDEKKGEHNGTIGSASYFSCKAGHGVLVAPDQVVVQSPEDTDSTQYGFGAPADAGDEYLMVN
mmetsp:Transcript_386/g.1061  ORF Transcript_386/g.1061 Transcript_386/m.1061 type:complete len:2458 (+) Transcript_386:127-7500(+)